MSLEFLSFYRKRGLYLVWYETHKRIITREIESCGSAIFNPNINPIPFLIIGGRKKQQPTNLARGIYFEN